MAAKKKENVKKDQRITIPPPQSCTAKFRIVGTAPLVQNAFPTKAREQMKAKQQAGSQAKKGGAREAKDFQQCYEQAQHISREGWSGIPANAFRSALVSACRLVDFHMTIAKITIFIVADGYDRVDGTPLVRIIEGEPHYVEHAVRNASGVADIRPRPMWDYWACDLMVEWDARLFQVEDIANLLLYAGKRIGVQEGRPDSRKSAGVGWGTFKIE